MANGDKLDSLTPFWVGIRGEVEPGRTAELYARILELAKGVGALSSTQSVSIIFEQSQNGEQMNNGGLDSQPPDFKATPLDLPPNELENRLRNLGNVLRSTRQSQHKSQMELARHAGVSQSYLSQLELGRRSSPPDVSSLVSLATSLGLSPVAVLEAGGYSVITLETT